MQTLTKPYNHVPSPPSFFLQNALEWWSQSKQNCPSFSKIDLLIFFRKSLFGDAFSCFSPLFRGFRNLQICNGSIKIVAFSFSSSFLFCSNCLELTEWNVQFHLLLAFFILLRNFLLFLFRSLKFYSWKIIVCVYFSFYRNEV